MSYNKRYPNAYTKENRRYVYYGDDGEEFCLTAGEDGVTEEYIAILKKMHREEIASDLRYQRVRKTEDGYKPMLCSLDAIPMIVREESMFFADKRVNIEETLIREETMEKYREQMNQALETLSDNQRMLIVSVYICKTPQTRIAEEEGVTPAAIRRRLDRIIKRLKKICF